MDTSLEGLHRPTTDLLWRESYYFNFVGSDLAIETTVGLRPHQRIVERMVLVFYRDQTLIFSEPGRLAEFTPSILQASTVSYDCIVPLEQWHVHIAGEFLVLPAGEEVASFIMEVRNGQQATRSLVVLDLAFQGVMLPYLYSPGALDFIGPNTQHYEQVGQWTGTVRIGEHRSQEVTGLGVRDHSWGVRDWLRAEEWYWASVLRPDEYLVLAYGRAAGEDWTGSGFMHTQGTTRPLRQVSVKAQYDDHTTMLVGEAQVEARTDNGHSFLARIYCQRAVQFIPARGPESLLRISTNVGAARDRVWLVEHGRREGTGVKGE